MNLTDITEHVYPPSNPILMQIILVIVILFLAVVLAKGITLYIQRYLKDKMDKEKLALLLKLIYYSIIITAITGFIFPVLNIDTSGLLVAGGVVGIILGFASQSTVGNFIAGIFLMLERPIKIGDAVSINDNFGMVEDINILSTIIRTFDGLYMRIPNQTVFTTNITNFVANQGRRFEYSVGIRYSDDADKAIRVIKELIDEQPYALANPSPNIFVDTLGDSSVNLIVRVWAPATEWFDLRTKLLWLIKERLEANDIQIPFPQRRLWFPSDVNINDVKLSNVLNDDKSNISPTDNEQTENIEDMTERGK
ncbi:MAG: mechanosensitive ion channel family protein [Methanolobus sp.]|nr:mechanosensitive ion channel family protein [Methanolobus sp.]